MKNMELKTKKQKLPKWFDGDVYEEGGVVKNPFSGEEYELTAIELSLYDFIIGAQIVFDTFNEPTDKQIKNFEDALHWFRVNNPEAYYVLLD